MFEFEATDRAARAGFFSANKELEVRESPAEFSRAARVAPLAWGEHCVECAIPHCYTSCDLYRARPDGKCRRFTFGIHPNRDVRTFLPYGAEIDFRVISHLWTKGSAVTWPLWKYRAYDRMNRVAARAVDTASALLGPLSGRRRPNRGFYLARRELVQWQRGRGGVLADGFLLQVINPHERSLEMRFEAWADPRPANAPIFQTSFPLRPGFSEHWVPVRAIQGRVDLSRPFEMSLLLGNSDPTLLYLLSAAFVAGVSGPITQRIGVSDPEAGDPGREDPSSLGAGWEGQRLEAVRDEEVVSGRRGLPVLSAAPGRGAQAGGGAAPLPSQARTRPMAKCVIWDLDHTLWEGILVESEGSAPLIRPGVAEVLKALDERGILQSVASKNNLDQAIGRLEELGLAEYFLFPEVGWGPKSEGVRRIIDNLNIGADTVVFIDDQPFERAEVVENIPDVEVLSESAIDGLLQLTRFRVRPSAEGKRRREKYRDQARREAALAEHGSDYIAFLRNARITLDIHPPRSEELDRVHELIQRTNQMNFSGNRYSRGEVEARIGEPGLDAFVLRVTDRFGDYGLVGFAFIDVDDERARLVDFAMSCRVQAKHVEHQFLLAFLDMYRSRGLSRFEVEFQRTERNAPVARVFTDLDFERGEDMADGREVHVFDLGRESYLRDYIEVVREAALGAVG